ncbi:hypothetical protein HDF16_003288 [Granulicella aggregans]|uniref:DUF4252 domain-containing protein n=1 Tax=Granulicella aggregans TaxID=474949 RepID=A0A7W7ZFE0_9BACT|nr:hypothetical protein [Granulicella aggregans]MBB5058574.1 hypothetical protein [Granulicella aggregans]
MRKLAEYSDGILMILAGVTFAVVLMLVPNAGASAHDSDALARRDFDGLVRSIADRYQIHGRSVPMMWVANLFARSVTKGGVQGMKVVEFEDVPKWGESDRAGLGDLVKERLSRRWSPMVRQHEADGGDSFIYIQGAVDGKHTRMIVVDLDGGEASRELDMVSMTLNPEQLAKWMKEEDAKDEKKRSAVGSSGSE